MKQPVEPDLTRLREIFNTYRESSGMTYDALAAATGLSRRVLVNIGTGATQGELRTWLLLSSAWGVGLDDMLAPLWSDARRRHRHPSATSNE